MRPLLSGVSALLVLLLGACASAPDRPFTLIKSGEGWVQMKAPPEEMGAIVASAGQSIQEMLDSRKYRVTWFSRKSDDYLIYFQVRDNGDSACGDEAPEFYKDEEGHWIEDRLSRISICKR